MTDAFGEEEGDVFHVYLSFVVALGFLLGLFFESEACLQTHIVSTLTITMTEENLSSAYVGQICELLAMFIRNGSSRN